MLNRVLLIIALLVASGLCAAKPNIELREALCLAEAYIAEHKVPNNDRYLAGITWHEDYLHPEKSHWIISWDPIELITDHLLVVRVYANGKITHQDSWA